MDWDATAKEATVRIHPEQDTLWIAHIPPYTHGDLLHLLAEIDARRMRASRSSARPVQGRDLHLVTVTDFTVPDDAKKVVWLQARQHAGRRARARCWRGHCVSWTSDDEKARELRRRVIFKFTPMMDPDGCANGGVRFNANGYDVNRPLG